jgi:HlyD family secretion protein
LIIFCTLFIIGCQKQRDPQPTTLVPEEEVVAAAGLLQPKDDILLLTGPMLANGGAARIQSIKVKESEPIRRGQALATFDNLDKLLAEQETIKTNIRTKKSELKILEEQTKRYVSLNKSGTIAKSDLEDRELTFYKLKAELLNLESSLKESLTRSKDAILQSPVNGHVLKIIVRDGGRDSGKGIMEVADTTAMQAELQVDERDIKLVKMNQSVQIKSENKSFNSTLHGKVCEIGRKIARRESYGSNPREASDNQRRVVEVRACLNPESSRQVSSLVGAQVIATFGK